MTTVFVTALLIATDAFFIGMSLGMQRSFKIRNLFIINLIIFAMSMVVYFVAGYVKHLITFDTSIFVGAVFVFMGLLTIIEKNKDTPCGVIALGFTMSIDASIGTAALVTSQAQTILIPVLIAATHLLYIFVGAGLGRCMKFSPRTGNIISGCCLMAVGLLNVL